jgi:sulfate transport system permease protein
VASLLALLALVTLVIKSVAEWRHERDMKAAAELPPERPPVTSQAAKAAPTEQDHRPLAMELV